MADIETHTVEAEIKRIEDGLRAANLSIKHLCSDAKIAPSTWTRWKSQQAKPNWGTFEKVRASFAKLTEAAA